MTEIIGGNTRRQLVAYLEVPLGSGHCQLESTDLVILNQDCTCTAGGDGDFDDRDVKWQPGAMAMLWSPSIDSSKVLITSHSRRLHSGANVK